MWRSLRFLLMTIPCGYLAGGYAWAEQSEIPSESAQETSLGVVKEVYRDRWAAAKSPDQKRVLATDLLSKSRTVANDTERYVLLKVALEMALQSGDCPTAFQAIAAREQQFKVNGYELREAAIIQVSKSAKQPEQFATLAYSAFEFLGETVNRDDFVAAEAAGKLMVEAARKSKDTGLTKSAVAKSQEIDELAQQYEAVKPHLEKLEDAPLDRIANLAAGKYYCFQKGDWKRGIPMLALSPEPPHAGLAKKELSADLTLEDRIALGDGWWDVALREKIGKRNIQLHAAHWYEQVVTRLNGIAKDRVVKRLADLEADQDAAGPIDLLRFVNDKSEQKGWQLRDGVFESPKATSQALIPYAMPEEYRLTVVLERKEGNNIVSLVLPVKDTAFQLVLDCVQPEGMVSGLNLIDGKKAELNASRFNGQLLKPRQRHTLECVVTKGKIKASVDKRAFMEWSEIKRLSILPIFPDPAQSGVTVFVYDSSIRIHEMRLTPISGRGHRIW